MLDKRGARIVGLPAGALDDVALAQSTAIHPDDLGATQAAFAAGMADTKPFTLEYRVIHPDGSVHNVVSRGILIADETGRPLRVVATNRDATAEHHAAAERERILAAERDARQTAEAANRTKAAFLAVMSHELRTPLNAIGGYAELMQMGIRGPVTPAQVEDLGRIQASQRHLLGLISEVLNYAKVEMGMVQYDIIEFPLRDALVLAEALVEPQARARGLVLAVAECPSDLTVRADRDKVQQILVNLLYNAVKFTEVGGHIALSAECSEEMAHVTVRDTGIGIEADQLRRIFDPFVQVRSDLTRTAEGTGLGLAISRELARGMNGELQVASEPGIGSVFTLTLPCA